MVGQFISPTSMQARRFRGDIVLNGNLAPVCCWCEKCKLSKVLLLRLVDYASYSLLYIINNGGPALLCIKHAMSETIQTHELTTTNTTLIIFRLSRASPSNFALSLPCTLRVTLKFRLKCSLDFILNKIHPVISWKVDDLWLWKWGAMI